jgi:hypothetical protein
MRLRPLLPVVRQQPNLQVLRLQYISERAQQQKSLYNFDTKCFGMGLGTVVKELAAATSHNVRLLQQRLSTPKIRLPLLHYKLKDMCISIK